MPFTLPTLPAELDWSSQPAEWKIETQKLTIVSGPVSDWFIDPAGGSPKGNAPAAWFTPPDTHFLLSARVTVDFSATYDAGVLFLHAGPQLWAKLCFEYSPQGQPMIVSVVTRGVSDDCNAVPIDGATVYLRLTQTPQTSAFHYSLDGKYWHFVRYFSLGKIEALKVGFLSQAPTGQGCRVTFSDIGYRPGRLTDYRNGE